MKHAMLAVAALLLAMAPAARGEWLAGTVTLSDGASVRGNIYVTNDRILLQDAAAGKRYTIRTAEIARLENMVEKQGMEEKWVFAQGGSDQKVYLGQYYPVRRYMTEVTFRDGRALQGHLIAATLYVRNAAGRRRFILREKEDGKVGQKLSDLVYVQSVVFSRPSEGALGAISGRIKLPPGERPVKVMAVNREDLFSVEGRFSTAGDTYTIPGCTEGTYDLIVLTDRAVYLDFSLEREKGSARLDAAAVGGIQAWVNTLRDFFDSQTITYGAGSPKRALVLVRQERRGRTSLAGLARLYRYEVWAMSKPKDQWMIDRRIFVYRRPSRNAALKPLRMVVDGALGGHAVSARTPDVKLDLELPARGEEAIPSHKPPEVKADVERSAG